MTTAMGTMGMATEEVGRFDRTLPPRTRVQYDPRWELGLEVMRWFHYRYGFDVGHSDVQSVEALTTFMVNSYERYLGARVPKKTWPIVQVAVVEPRIREFMELFKDVLAEIELLRPA